MLCGVDARSFGAAARWPRRALAVAVASLACVFGSPPAWAQAPTDAPANLRAVVGDGRLTFHWDAVAGATGYRYRLKAGSAAWGAWTPVAAGTSHTAANLANGTAHQFKVRAVNGGRKGPASSVSATPRAALRPPANLRAAAGNRQVTLAWSAVSGAEGYDYRRKEGAAAYGAWTAATSTSGAAATSTLRVAPLRNDVEHAFQVRGTRAGERGPASAEARATPHVPLPAPANLAAYGGPGRVLLQWDAVAGAAGHEHRQSGAAAWRAATSTSVSVGGLTNGARYAFEVRGAHAYRTAASATVSATPAATSTHLAMPAGSDGRAGGRQRGALVERGCRRGGVRAPGGGRGGVDAGGDHHGDVDRLDQRARLRSAGSRRREGRRRVRGRAVRRGVGGAAPSLRRRGGERGFGSRLRDAARRQGGARSGRQAELGARHAACGLEGGCVRRGGGHGVEAGRPRAWRQRAGGAGAFAAVADAAHRQQQHRRPAAGGPRQPVRVDASRHARQQPGLAAELAFPSHEPGAFERARRPHFRRPAEPERVDQVEVAESQEQQFHRFGSRVADDFARFGVVGSAPQRPFRHPRPERADETQRIAAGGPGGNRHRRDSHMVSVDDRFGASDPAWRFDRRVSHMVGQPFPTEAPPAGRRQHDRRHSHLVVSPDEA